MIRLDNDMREQVLAQYPGLEDPFDDDYVKREIAWYNAPDEYEQGTVKLVKHPLLGRCDDYLNVNFRADPTMVVPVFAIEGQTYMSLTPMEVQSATLAIYLAAGDVATCGLGMGYFALKCAAKDNVTRVTVYERNQDVIDYFTEHFADREGYEKIVIVKGDARETLRERRHDFVYVDTYATMLPDEIVDDIALYGAENEINEYWFWGLERVVLSALVNEQISTYDIPNELRVYFLMWQSREASDLRFDECDPDYSADVLNALAESVVSSLDLIIEQ